MEAKFLTELEVRYLDDENAVLLSPLWYQSKILNGILKIPQGFVNDFSSTPRVPIVYMAYGNRAHHEGVPHDFLYRSPDHLVEITREDGTVEKVIVSKFTADKVYLEAMGVRGKKTWIKFGMFLGVLFGGFSSYRTGHERFRIMKLANGPFAR